VQRGAIKNHMTAPPSRYGVSAVIRNTRLNHSSTPNTANAPTAQVKLRHGKQGCAPERAADQDT
jgi:hypothetical protein